MTDNKNPLNIRPGDVLEYTGAFWTGSFQGKKQEVVRVSEGFAFYERGTSVNLAPSPGHEFIVHYAVQDGDQYRYIHTGMAGATYAYSDGEPYLQGDSGSCRASFSKEFVTSENFVRLASEASPGAEAEPELVGRWVSASLLSPVKDGDRVRFTGSEKEYQARMVKDHQGFDAVSVELAPGVHHQCLYQDLEVFREVIQLPTEFGHYESIHEGVTYDLNEDGWSEMNGGERLSISREQIEESAPLERVYTKEELDERLAGLREGFEDKRAKARERFDGYQEELLEIIRRRNSEKEALIAQIERLGKQVYDLGGEPVV